MNDYVVYKLHHKDYNATKMSDSVPQASKQVLCWQSWHYSAIYLWKDLLLCMFTRGVCIYQAH